MYIRIDCKSPHSQSITRPNTKKTSTIEWTANASTFILRFQELKVLASMVSIRAYFTIAPSSSSIRRARKRVQLSLSLSLSLTNHWLTALPDTTMKFVYVLVFQCKPHEQKSSISSCSRSNKLSIGTLLLALWYNFQLFFFRFHVFGFDVFFPLAVRHCSHRHLHESFIIMIGKLRRFIKWSKSEYIFRNRHTIVVPPMHHQQIPILLITHSHTMFRFYVFVCECLRRC